VNSEGRYCGASIDAVTCKNCLPKQSEKYCDFIRPHESLREWRKAWGDLILLADEIVVFSKSSLEILTKVYSIPNQKNISVRPHEFSKEYLRPVKETKGSGAINLGIVGGISYAKGAEIIKNLSELAAKKAFDNFSLSIIGDLSLDYVGSDCLVTGRYSRENLVDTVENLGINIFLMPSIWPETYSYVTDEMMAMNLPIICFNVGAQAERISKYSKGLVLDVNITTDELLTEIQSHFETYRLTALDHN
jgi:glycosyltransferase involved in cell wall biosynthesis